MQLALDALALTGLALGALYALLTLVNLAIFRTPRGPRPDDPRARVSILIPARDEAANVGAAIDRALAQEGAEVEVLVLDDGSTDGTGGIVAARAAADARVRLLKGALLPSGWNGKQHACHQLSQAARMPVLLFVDADVRLAPGAAARMHAYLLRRRLDLVSGFPRQVTRTIGEIVAIPQILVLLLGYLPFPMARLMQGQGFAAGCGQLMMVRAEAYRAAGGHAAFRGLMHDGLNLPRNVRAAGLRTDILDATPLARVRMYDNWPDLWQGFSKNATEGMAKPVALPIWTVLLLGGHVLPLLLLPIALGAGAERAFEWSLWTVIAVGLARTALMLKVRQHPLSVLLHPFGVIVTLAIQWSALLGRRRGAQAHWRGRAYDMN